MKKKIWPKGGLSQCPCRVRRGAFWQKPIGAFFFAIFCRFDILFKVDGSYHELRKMVEESRNLAEENNRLLRKIIRANRWARIFKLLYWLVIIGAMVGAYYYIQPFILDLIDVYEGLLSGVENLQKTGEAVSEAVNPVNLSPGLLDKIKEFFQ